MALRILIVDDNRDAADSLALILGLWEHNVEVAYDGEEGLQKAVATAPDCLILDINMPRMDGYTLAQLVRNEPLLEKAKLMALSALSDPTHVKRTEEAGFDYRLTKPVGFDELGRMLQMIEHVMSLAKQTEELAKRNIEVAERTEAIAVRTEGIARRSEAVAGETMDLLQEVKEEMKEVKNDVREMRQELKEIKDKVDRADDGEGWKHPGE
ncbi:Chemotaxis protein methyltransferase CheR [Fimbriiglobus ruber]|uniref:Chemotaxis protein methyltransferase CheR n=1 Tax=Fimbriiglobus ruber TaxID=1908690 RepID=A0A225DMA2_9BACT|nr:Chemotaxis protein methyltransferase CheR [Fimbriiglobus ruber]